MNRIIWDYLLVRHRPDDVAATGEHMGSGLASLDLKAFGREGWELVAVLGVMLPYELVFKRPILDTEEK